MLATIEGKKPLLGSESKTVTDTKTQDTGAVIDTVQDVRKFMVWLQLVSACRLC